MQKLDLSLQKGEKAARNRRMAVGVLKDHMSPRNIRVKAIFGLPAPCTLRVRVWRHGEVLNMLRMAARDLSENKLSEPISELHSKSLSSRFRTAGRS